jgi:flagellar hook-associated protein 2
MAGNLGIDGLVSGLDTSGILDALTVYRQAPINAALGRIEAANERRDILSEINKKVLTFQRAAQNLRFPSSFQRSTVTSSNENLLRATGAGGSLTGSFQFLPVQTAAASQFVSSGVTDPDRSAVSANGGTISLELGDARVRRETDLSRINGGRGFDRGSLRITDDTGATAVVDLTAALTLEDALSAINNSGAAVQARVDDDPQSAGFGSRIIVENLSGSGDLTISNVGGRRTAESLGIAGSGSNGSLAGTRIVGLSADTLLNDLNDGRGVRGGTVTISGSIGIQVNLSNARTVGDVLKAINDAGGGTITAAISETGRGLVLNDSGVPASLTVTGNAGATTAHDLGIATSMLQDTGSGFEGRNVMATAGSVLLPTVRGTAGGGITTPAEFTITDSQGAVTTIELTGREDLARVLARINHGAAQVEARPNAGGDGIELIDRAGGSGALEVADTLGNAAAQLGLEGTHLERVDGGSINVQHLNRNRSLSAFSDSQGGTIRVGLRNGAVYDVSLAGARTVGELLDRLSGVNGLHAAINATGDGIQLTDETGGSGELIIEDREGSVARGLMLAGRATADSVDRRLRVDVDVSATDTLNQVMLNIMDATSLVSVNTFGDGTEQSPARLSINGLRSGAAGTIMISSSVAELQFNQTSRARDAVMFMGGDGNDVQVLRSSNGRFDVLPGVQLDVRGATGQAVTVTLGRDTDGVLDNTQAMVDAYNELNELVREHTGFDPTTLEKGILHGDNAMRQLQNALRRMLLDPVPGLSETLNNAAGVGMRINREGELTFERDAMARALAERFDDVVRLFTHSAPVTGNTELSRLQLGQGLRPAPGPDLRVRLGDGSVLEVDLSGATTMAQVLQRLNADPRLEVSIGQDSRHLRLRDNTTGDQTFQITEGNGSGAMAALGLLSGLDDTGNGEIVGQPLLIADQLGIGRRLDLDLERYTSPLEGVFRRLNEDTEATIRRNNEDIERLEDRLRLERERIARQFASLEQFLAQSQSIQAQLTSQLKAIEPVRRK